MAISLKLFLDIVTSSSADITCALRGGFRGGYLYVSFRFKVKENLNTVGIVFVDTLIPSNGSSAIAMFNTVRNFNKSLNKRRMSLAAQTVTTE